MSRRVSLVAFVKDPWLLPAKTRLGASIGPRDALGLSREFLRVLAFQMRRFASRGWDVFIAHAPDQVSDEFSLLFEHVTCLPQGAGCLGQRIGKVDHQIRLLGVQVCVFIGGDSPDLDDDAIVRLASVSADEASLITASDGGFVALSAHRPLPAMDSIRWSDEHTASDLVALLKAHDFSVGIQGAWFDVDVLSDLIALEARLSRSCPSHLSELWVLCKDILDRHLK